jgi:hypothetical protein
VLKEVETRLPTMRIAAGLFVLLGAVTIPVLLFGVDGWRKSAVIPVLYFCWKFGNYAFRKPPA